MTEPDTLGPCEPGTAVKLSGIVWQETDKGGRFSKCIILFQMVWFLHYSIQIYNDDNWKKLKDYIALSINRKYFYEGFKTILYFSKYTLENYNVVEKRRKAISRGFI